MKEKVNNVLRCTLPAAAMLMLCLLAGMTGCAGSTAETPTYHQVSYDANGADSGAVPAEAASYEENSTFTILGNTGTLAKTGYSFNGWNTAADGSGTSYREGDSFTLGSGDVTFYAVWTAADGTAYTVNYYLQNITDDEYTLSSEDTATLTGTTGAQTAAVVKTYTGFTAQTVTQSAIAADGSTVVKVYYTRNSITLTFKADGGNWSGSSADITVQGKYGAAVTVTKPIKEGYAFVGWDSTVQTTFTADATYTAVWIAPAADAICETVQDASATSADSYGTNGTYKYFGSWPQTIKAAGVTVDTNTTKTMGAATYYLGSDGYWYAKATAAPCDSGYTFTNGTAVTADTEYYFKVEPIKWRVLESGKLLAESILANVCYYGDGSNRTLSEKTISANNYKYSNIRAWLNGTKNQFVTDGGTGGTYDVDWTNKGFLQTAFTDTAQTLIATTNVDNSAASTTDTGNNITQATSYYCDNTSDKIYLLSEREVTNSATYKFGAYDAKDTLRLRTVSDYARATGAYMYTTAGVYQYRGCWWLRSPYESRSYTACQVDFLGHAWSDISVNSADVGVVPALSITQ